MLKPLPPTITVASMLQWGSENGVEFSIHVEPSDNDPIDYCDGKGDPDYVHMCADVIASKDNVWRWCLVRVIAKHLKTGIEEYTSTQYTLENEEEYKEYGDYSGEMSEAVDFLEGALIASTGSK